MRKIVLGAAFAAMALALPLSAGAQVLQGTANGARNGADQGNEAAGPIGGIVGGAVGAGVGAATGAVDTATGIVGSIFGSPDERPRFNEYVTSQHRPSYRWSDDVRVGAVLPARGVTYYAVPAEYKVDRRYRYALVNDHAVIVDPRSRRIVDIID